MTRPPFDPDALDRHEETGPAAEELERYARVVTGVPSADLADRIMDAVATEPAPRRSPAAWLAALLSGRASGHRLARAGAIGAGLVLMIGAVLAAGEVAQLIGDRSQVGTSPSPTVMTAPPSPTTTPTPSLPVTPSPETTVSPTEPEPSAQPSEPEASASEASPTTAETPRESEHEDHTGTETPHPTETPRSSEDSGSDR